MSLEDQKNMCRKCVVRGLCGARDDFGGGIIEECCFGQYKPRCERKTELCDVVPYCAACTGATNATIAIVEES